MGNEVQPCLESSFSRDEAHMVNAQEAVAAGAGAVKEQLRALAALPKGQGSRSTHMAAHNRLQFQEI